jgi:hypothetical protein
LTTTTGGNEVKIITSSLWVLQKILFLCLAYLCYIAGYPLPGLALLVITLQNIFHEIIHGLTVIALKGEIQEISLGRHIDFSVWADSDRRTVYASGFFFEYGCILLSGWILVNSGGFLFPLLGTGMVLVGAVYATWPEYSDYNQWRKSKI